jgi:hypothetical protein
MKRFIGVILFLVISGLITDWLQWREPEWESSYDSSLLSKSEVLDIAEQLFVYQIKQDIGSTRDTSKGYHLHLFNGQFEPEFFERFDGRGFPAVNGHFGSGIGGATARATLHMIQFEQSDRHRLIVIFSKKYAYEGKRMFKAVFEKRNGKWNYLQT